MARRGGGVAPKGACRPEQNLAKTNSCERSVFALLPVAPSWHPQKFGSFGMVRKSSENIGFFRLFSESLEILIFTKASRLLFCFCL